MPGCCGLKALEQMTSVKNVSMFTLLHLAKDNGLDLYFCKVETNNLVGVVRPAIFHQKDHFVVVDNGEAMPEGEYDGYVLTPKPMGEPLPYSLAKKVTGGKKGSTIVAPIVTGVATIINPMLGAAVGAGFAAYNASQAPGGLGKNWWQVPVGAATAYLGGMAPGSTVLGMNSAMLAGGLAAGSNYAQTGNLGSAALAGLGQYGGAKFTQGAAAGLAGATGSVLDKAWSAGQGGINNLLGTGTTPGKIASGGIGANPTGTPGMGTGQSIASTPGGYGGTFTVPGVSNNVAGMTTPAGVSSPIGYTAQNAANLAGSAANLPGVAPSTPAPTNILDKLKGMLPGTQGANPLSAATWGQMAASTLLTPPKLDSNVTDNYSRAAQSLGIENFNALPEATRKQLQTYVDMPIQELASTFYKPDDKGLRLLEEQKQKAIDNLMAQYANYGQDPYTSSEAQTRLDKINRDFSQAQAEYEQQLQTAAMKEAVGFKQQMLSSAIQQGTFDYESAMELATYIGRDQEMKFALETKNYEALQGVLAEIFSLGLGQGKS